MKHIALALMLCAIPATAFAQSVSCNGCDHVAPYFKGNGGFIGTVADGGDKVTFVVFCGSVSTTGEAQVNGRTATQLFNQRNGLACDREGGSLEIAGLEDGGWYWITDDMNSAVGSLVRIDVLDNMPTHPTDPGSDDITLTPGKGAVFVKQASTGRVGILPTILPAPGAAVLRKCGFGTEAARPRRRPIHAGLARARWGMVERLPWQRSRIRTAERQRASWTRPASSVRPVPPLWTSLSTFGATGAATSRPP